MPIKIWRVTPEGQKNEEVAWLCNDCWRLPEQGDALTAWIAANAAKLAPADYIADIGFTPREDALGGGVAFSVEALCKMADLRMALFLSEYPGDSEPPISHDRSPIQSNPELMGGTLVFRGTRVPAQTLLDYLQDGFDLNGFLEEFPSVNRADAEELLRLVHPEQQ